MKLYLVRHGQTVTNEAGCWTGWYDAPLTEQGREDAIRARGFLSDLSFDKVYSSDLSRARDTALLALPGCVPEQTPLLREIHVGSYENRPFTILTPEAHAYTSEFGYAHLGGESYAAFTARVREFLALVEGRTDESVIAFTHGGLLHCMLEIMVGVRLPRRKFSCSNCTVAGFERRPEGWRVTTWLAP